MPDVKAAIAVKQSAGVKARQLWVSLTTADRVPKPIELNDEGKALLVLTQGTLYYIFWQFYGMAGDTLSFEAKTAAGRTVVELKESKIPSGKAYQAGVREFKA